MYICIVAEKNETWPLHARQGLASCCNPKAQGRVVAAVYFDVEPAHMLR